MEILHEIGILEVVAVTLAVVIMLGPLAPGAIYGYRSRRKK